MKNNTKLTLKTYWKFIMEYKYSAFFVLFSVISATMIGNFVPLYYKKFFDIISSTTQKDLLANELTGVLFAIGFIELGRWFLWRLTTFTSNRFQPKVISNLTNYCFEELHKRSFSYFNNNFVGSLVKRVNWFTRSFEGIIDRVTWEIIPLITSLTVIITVLSRKNIFLTLAIIVWLIIFLTINWKLTKYKIKFDIQRSEAESKASGILADTITNNHNVKLFVGYDREVGLFKNATEAVRKLRTHTWTLDAIFEAVQGFLTLSMDISILIFAVYFWKKNQLTIGDFVLIQTYLGSIFHQTWNFGKMVRNFYSNLADAEEMTALLNTPIEIQNIPNAKELQVTNGKIEFVSVDFNYNETRKIISDLNLSIDSNQKVALVGSSGSGKSTIIKLLLRMHDVTGGKVMIDGQNVSKIKMESLWKNVSLVPQDPILFHRTLMDNIRYGKPDATDEEVIAASKLAHCHDFIDELSDKYNTFVGERGIKLSGGERQRVAIARAILRNAPILVLDEATSSLDSESEAMIQDALNTLMKNKTVIVIAHRLSTIMKMDRIVVIKKGKIVEDGTHSALLQNENGIYSNLWKIQAGGFIKEKPSIEDDVEEVLVTQADNEIATT